jgi:hypothetical protein
VAGDETHLVRDSVEAAASKPARSGGTPVTGTDRRSRERQQGSRVLDFEWRRCGGTTHHAMAAVAFYMGG